MLLQGQSMTLMVKERMSYHSTLATFFGLRPRANSLVSGDGFWAPLMAVMRALFLLTMLRLVLQVFLNPGKMIKHFHPTSCWKNMFHPLAAPFNIKWFPLFDQAQSLLSNILHCKHTKLVRAGKSNHSQAVFTVCYIIISAGIHTKRSVGSFKLDVSFNIVCPFSHPMFCVTNTMLAEMFDCLAGALEWFSAEC